MTNKNKKVKCFTVATRNFTIVIPETFTLLLNPKQKIKKLNKKRKNNNKKHCFYNKAKSFSLSV